MISQKECRACCLDQIRRLADILGTDQSQVLQAFEAELKKSSTKTAPEYAELIFNAFKELTGVEDPYKDIKNNSNIEAVRLLPVVEKEVSKKLSGIQKLIEMAIIGNIIDYGAFKEVHIEDLIRATISAPYFKYHIKALEKDLAKSKNILYITDNAGEIIFDAALLKHLHKNGKNITLAVRSEPIINDATHVDALFAGLHKFAQVISTGTKIPGIITKRCSPEFVKALYDADLVISKGQGNFETLYIEPHKPKKLYYLFVVKCQTVAKLIGANVKDKVLWSSIS